MPGFQPWGLCHSFSKLACEWYEKVLKVLETSFFLYLVSPEIVPFSFGTEAINQGEVAQLMCIVRKGDEPLSLTWSLKGDIISSDPDLSTTMIGSRTSVLTVSAVKYRHSGVYTCRASNPAGTVSHAAHLLVNGMFN